MKPGDRIIQIHKEKLEKYAGVELPPEKYVAIGYDAIVQYLNEQYEANKTPEQRQADVFNKSL